MPKYGQQFVNRSSSKNLRDLGAGRGRGNDRNVDQERRRGEGLMRALARPPVSAAASRATEKTATADDIFRQVLDIEKKAISAFLDSRVGDVGAIVSLLAEQERPIVCMGIGKSGLIAAKIAATFSSLGTPAFFLNAAEAAHGDLGAIQTGNTILLFSNSGTTEELCRILPLLKARECCLIGLVGRQDSPLARAVDHLILAEVAQEADHIGMAPTASTTLQMAIGDALAVAVSQVRSFTRDDFLSQHPAGLLGRRQIKVRHLMRTGDDLPTVLPHASVAELVGVISAKRLGAACVVDWEGHLLGLVVDGDLRRLVQNKGDFYSTPVCDIMTRTPRVIKGDLTVGDVLIMMQQEQGRFAILPVVDDNGRLEGLLHAYDVVQ